MGSFKLWVEAQGWGNIKRDLEAQFPSSVVEKIGSLDIVRNIDPRYAYFVANLLHWADPGSISWENLDKELTAFAKIRKKFKGFNKLRAVPESIDPIDLPLIRDLDQRDVEQLLDAGFIKRVVRDLSKYLETPAEESEELPVESTLGNFVMYKITTKEQAKRAKDLGAPNWCVLGDHFGSYDGPPYYPIVKKVGPSLKWISMVIPGHMSTDPSQALRNAANTNIIDAETFNQIKPLVQKWTDPVVPEKKPEVSVANQFIELVFKSFLDQIPDGVDLIERNPLLQLYNLYHGESNELKPSMYPRLWKNSWVIEMAKLLLDQFFEMSYDSGEDTLPLEVAQNWAKQVRKYGGDVVELTKGSFWGDEEHDNLLRKGLGI